MRATNDEGTGVWSDSGSGTTDANAAPTFSSSATFDAAENQTEAGTVQATDSDADDDVTGYAITGGADRSFFSIGSTSGELTFAEAPNYEDAEDQDTNNTYVVQVTATSGAAGRVKTATQTITVTVTDVAGEAPGKPGAPTVASASATSLAVNWSAPSNAGPAITDYDVQYRAGTSGDWSDGGHAGTAVTATLSGLSENTSYQVQVRATNDEGTGVWSDAGSGTTDANAAPTFSSSATFDAAENQTEAGTVQATDSDADDDITGYAITGGADQAFFSSVENGLLTFAAAPNYEDAQDQGTNNTYVVEVTATSGTDTREKTATQTITVTVTDAGGEAPDKPAAPTVTAASPTSLAVNWSAPSNAGPAITDYDVQYRAGTSEDWSDAGHAGTAVTATLTGLSENTAYQVQVRASNDEGTGVWSDSGSGTTDANAAPTFSSSATFDAAENQTEAGTVQATDSDADDDVTGYAITGGADRSFFSIGATSGELTFAAAPNYEDAEDQDTNNTYVVQVTATSGAAGRVKTATQTITVTVTDVAGEAPGAPLAPSVAAASLTSLAVSWSAPPNEGPAISDYDVQYRAGDSTTTSGTWSALTHDGTAASASIAGLSEDTSYQVQVRATNDEGTGDWSAAGVGATSANAAPAFTSDAAFGPAENQTAAGTVLAADSDAGDDITGYALSGGADQTFFSIGATSGELAFKTAPNFESPGDANSDGVYLVTVRATSGAGEREKTADQQITVTVTDVDTEAPGKPNAPSVAAASLTSLAVSWSAPPNEGPAISDYDVQYRAGDSTTTSGTWSALTHDGTAASASIAGLSEDTSYQVQVRASNDEGTGDWSAAGVGATSANAAPAFTSDAAFGPAENQTAVGTVLAADSDAGDDITGYALSGGADQTFFSIGATSGELAFKTAPNFESPGDANSDGVYLVTVRATSGTGEREKTADQQITVTVTDVDTEAPGAPLAPSVAAASLTSLAVSWSAPSNEGPAISDYDVQYRAGDSTTTSGTWSALTHDGTAASASIAGLSEDTSYQVQVRATNDEGTGDWSAAGVGATSANAAPAFTSDAAFGPAENQTAAGTVLAADSDAGDDITGYALSGGADQTFFSIGATSGELAFKTAPNFESPGDANSDGVYLVTVRATSGAGEREKTADQQITVTVTDVDTEAPGKPNAPSVAAASLTSLAVSWSAPPNEGPAISDYDVQYRAGDSTTTSGAWSALTHDGTAASASIAGLSEDTSYQVQVRATNDEGTGDWSAAGVGATSANAAPAFTSDAAFGPAENQTAVGTVLAADSDAGDDITGYALSGGADQTFFSIGATSGDLAFKTAPNFESPGDANSDGVYLVTVRATSGAGEREKTADQQITVTVTDVDTEAPGKPNAPSVAAASLTSLAVSWSAPPNEGPAISDYDVQYRAGDSTTTSGAWSALTHDGTAASASIAGLSEDTSYQVQVRASNDEGTGDWSAAGVGATSANAAPAFSSLEAFGPAENQTAAGTVLAADSDAGDDITGYALSGGADQTFFSIGATSGDLAFKTAPNFESPGDANSDGVYLVTVRATSGTGEREKTADQQITVTVGDVDTEAPGKPNAPSVAAASLTSLAVSWSAPPNEGPAISDYDVQYRAGDSTTTSGAWSPLAHDGTAAAATIAGLSEDTSYQVQVRASNDEGTGDWSAAGVGATSANAAPAFTSDAAFGPAENQTAVGTVLAADSDAGDDITGYALSGGADQTFFSIGATSGELAFKTAPNFESPGDANSDGVYLVTVRATSGTGEREKTADQQITVTVTDVDTEAPGAPLAPSVAAASLTSLAVSWSAPPNEGPAISDYDVQYRAGDSTTTSGAWSALTHDGTAASASIAGLSEDTSYQVQVRATNDEGTGDWSAAGVGATSANAAPAFTSDAAFGPAENQTAAGTVLAADSDAGDDVTGYAITGGADQAFFSIGATSGALTFDAAPNFESPGDANSDGVYLVTVRATSGAGEREKTADQQITVTVGDVDTEAPGKPNAPSVAAASLTSLAVSWSAPANEGPAISDYDVHYRAGDSTTTSGDWTTLAHDGTAASATIAGLSEDTSYQVQVRATNAEGTGDWSEAGVGATSANAAPSAPTDLSAIADGSTQIDLSWNAPASDGGAAVTGYKIEVSENGGTTWTDLAADTGDTATTYTHSGLDPGTTRHYQVSAINTAGTGTASNVAHATTDAAPPEAPAGLSATASAPDQIDLAWSAPANDGGSAITGYRIESSPDGSSSWSDLVADTNSDATAYFDTSLSAGTTRHYRVSAINSAGTSDPSNIDSATTPAAGALTASFADLPATHDGSSPFNVDIAFSADIDIGLVEFLDHTVEAIGGYVIAANHVNGSRDLWRIRVEPDGSGDVTLALEADRPCDEDGAVCTADGRPLALPLSGTVEGPASTEVSVTAAASLVTEGQDAPFSVSRTGGTAGSLIVSIEVSQNSSFLNGPPPSAVTIPAGSLSVTLGIPTENDSVKEDDGSVTVTLLDGPGYHVHGPARSATVLVHDDDSDHVDLSANPEQVPARHDGSSPFEVRFRFSEPVSISGGAASLRSVEGQGAAAVKARRDDDGTVTPEVAFLRSVEVQGGTADEARSYENGSLWGIVVVPTGQGGVTVTLRPADCAEPGALCTAEGRPLARAVTVTVPGPSRPAQPPPAPRKPQALQLALWTDKPGYRPDDTVRLYLTLDRHDDRGRYVAFAYLEPAGDGPRRYLSPLPGPARLHEEPTDFRGLPLGVARPRLLRAADRALAWEGPAPAPGPWQFALELRPEPPQETDEELEEPRQLRRAWARFTVAERSQLLNRPDFDREVSADMTLRSDTLYYLLHQLFVHDGATLTIEPGTVVHAWGPRAAIVVEQGGRIVAEGTREAPVVLTCSLPAGRREPGCWGGVRILGRAPVTRLEGRVPGVTPPERPAYGGSAPHDSSGTMRYVRVEFAGAGGEPGAPAPAVGVYGAGDGTVLDHVQARASLGDGFAFSGGAAACGHCVASESGAAGLAWDRGWQGTASHLFVQHSRGGTDGIRGSGDALGHDLEPRSRPALSHVTLVHSIPYGRRERKAAGLRLDTGSGVKATGLLATRFGGGAIVASGRSALLFAEGESFVGDALLYRNGYRPGEGQLRGGIEAGVQFRDRDPKLRDLRYFANPDPRPKPGSPALERQRAAGSSADGAQPADDGQEAYVGAFGREENWLDGWTIFGSESDYDEREADRGEQ